LHFSGILLGELRHTARNIPLAGQVVKSACFPRQMQPPENCLNGTGFAG